MSVGTPRAEVIVVGVGCMGSAACHHLAQRGVRVLGLEKHAIPHDLGSSGHQSRAFRMAYHEHPDYVPLLKRARMQWLELSAEIDEPVFIETGGLYGARSGTDFVRLSASAAETHDVPFERLDVSDVHSRYPVVSLPDDFEAMYEPGAGIVVPENAVTIQAAMARRAGARLVEGIEVLEWTSTAGGVMVRTSDGVFEADHLVLCAGAWSQGIAGLEGIELRPSRQVLGWVEPTRHADLSSLPIWAFELDDTSILYGFPLISGLPGPVGFKVARHWAAQTTDPDTIDRSWLHGDEGDFEAELRRFFPDSLAGVRDIRICMYSNSPDQHFVLDAHPGVEHVTVAAGFSGHGFKFAPVIGEAIADLAMTGRSELPIDFLSLARLVGP